MAMAAGFNSTAGFVAIDVGPTLFACSGAAELFASVTAREAKITQDRAGLGVAVSTETLGFHACFAAAAGGIDKICTWWT